LRQLRRDKTVFGFVMNVVRLDLEEDERLEHLPALRDTPDEDLQHLRRIARYWLGVASIHFMRKSRCSPEAAVHAVSELREELEETVPEAEIRAVPLREVLDVPAELLPRAC
jgi:hypothetical protein